MAGFSLKNAVTAAKNHKGGDFMADYSCPYISGVSIGDCKAGGRCYADNYTACTRYQQMQQISKLRVFN